MTFVWIILGIAGFLILLFILGVINAFRATFSRNRKLDKMIAPALTALKNDEAEAKDIIMEYAKNPITRNHLYQALKAENKADFFPSEFLSEEKIAESDMIKWLMHGNELGAAPTEIQLVAKLPVSQDDKNGSIYLFQFRINPPHWAADSGWMAGVSGPFWDDEDITDFELSSGTFSEFEPFDSRTYDEHVAYLKQKINATGLVIRC
jgi:hypothetical protein